MKLPIDIDATRRNVQQIGVVALCGGVLGYFTNDATVQQATGLVTIGFITLLFGLYKEVN